jgi:hypothetical protein
MRSSAGDGLRLRSKFQNVFNPILINFSHSSLNLHFQMKYFDIYRIFPTKLSVYYKKSLTEYFDSTAWAKIMRPRAVTQIYSNYSHILSIYKDLFAQNNK